MGQREEECTCGERSGTMMCRLFIEIFLVNSFFFYSRSWMTLSSLLFYFTGKEEPIFGRPQKVDVYAQVKQQKKYIS